MPKTLFRSALDTLLCLFLRNRGSSYRQKRIQRSKEHHERLAELDIVHDQALSDSPWPSTPLPPLPPIATSRFSRRSPLGYYNRGPTNGRFRRTNTVAEPGARSKSSLRGSSIPFSISRHLLLPVKAATVRRSDQTSSR